MPLASTSVHEDPHFSSDTLIQLCIPEFPPEKTGVLKRLLRNKKQDPDPYCAQKIAQLHAAANRYANETYKLMRKPTCPESDKAQLQEALDDLQQTFKAWEDAVRRREKGEAGKRCRDADRAIDALGSLKVSTATKIKKTKELESDFAPIMRRRRPSLVLTCPTRSAQICVLGYRKTTVENTIAWFESGHKEKRIHWLYGKRKAGKTTVLHHLAVKFICATGQNFRVASVVFRDNFDLHDFVAHFLPTIIVQLAERAPKFKAKVAKVGLTLQEESDAKAFFEGPLDDQIQRLLIAPYEAAANEEEQELKHKPPLLILLDDLDKCHSAVIPQVFNFMEQTLKAGLPIYFIIAGSASSKAAVSKAFRQHWFLNDFVDKNEVIDYPQVVADAIESGLASIPPPSAPPHTTTFLQNADADSP